MFEPVKNSTQIEAVVALAEQIWTEHYTPIIGQAQVSYMLQRYQTAAVIRDELQQLQPKVEYYLMTMDTQYLGYLGIRYQDDGIFLSKIYVSKVARGQGFSRLAMDFLKQKLRDVGGHQISLTVNKHNSDSIAAYQRLGFVITQEVCIDIGGGFEMDDYRMSLTVPAS
ncbi:GNAT family N-acetyltransferase [Alginatibacterium sediminis]|uniref:GNAT family N-acetyltransferase n=1 Tax=Alginatibacterium sediminis TaxID=2164068 RepID=A0A420E844_9ALTE|nr:GNAT family N-acetyltransferase [Alginatibacterium sediminis]RKF15575.1 GNAT family N-acetyltransferase [Alginatibacterium sediminis]